MRRHCSATTAAGTPCGAAPLRERDMCFVHDPDSADEAAAARRVGGLRRRREGSVRVAYDLDGLDGLERSRRLLDITITDVLALDNGIQRARVLLLAVRTDLELIEKADFEVRLTRLEAALAPRARRERAKRGMLRADGVE
jgi:hypothetical protein